MKLVSMKRTADRKAEEPVVTAESEYPWGLRLSLNKAELDRLGAKPGKVGDGMEMAAKVRVVSVSLHEGEDGERHTNVELQITDMALRPEDKRSAADVLFGGDG